jgi:hypothetical protein
MSNENEESLDKTNLEIDDEIIDLEVFVDPDENHVYVKFSGFSELEDAEDYADYLLENLPLLLFQSKTIH